MDFQNKKVALKHFFVKLIKQYCDVDVIAAINRKHQVEE